VVVAPAPEVRYGMEGAVLGAVRPVRDDRRVVGVDACKLMCGQIQWGRAGGRGEGREGTDLMFTCRWQDTDSA
jgi:hypothetical protein